MENGTSWVRVGWKCDNGGIFPYECGPQPTPPPHFTDGGASSHSQLDMNHRRFNGAFQRPLNPFPMPIPNHSDDELWRGKWRGGRRHGPGTRRCHGGIGRNQRQEERKVRHKERRDNDPLFKRGQRKYKTHPLYTLVDTLVYTLVYTLVDTPDTPDTPGRHRGHSPSFNSRNRLSLPDGILQDSWGGMMLERISASGHPLKHGRVAGVAAPPPATDS